MSAPFRIRRLSEAEAIAAAPALGEVLLDCVDGGASIGFMASLTRAEATAFWRGEAEARDGRAILVAEDADGIFGVVQLIPPWQPNQPHRADVAKMLVHRRARRLGAARALMIAIEAEARAMGRWLLVLDTVTGGAAEGLYAGVGWTKVGVIDNYALMPDGAPCATTYFCKDLRG
ncbi:GNAT family N-acetyltransferase [Phenylobacterium sp.]|uniref:GNAT family N-acetyltransferase n=1 Tax=Phenylobacterium sp. TaxID=1871053 RepID=UPI00356A7571